MSEFWKNQRDKYAPTVHEKLEASINANLRAKGLIRDEDGVPRDPVSDADHEADLAYKRGYQAALNDMLKQLEELQQRRRSVR
jgi:hypothetical protein